MPGKGRVIMKTLQEMYQDAKKHMNAYKLRKMKIMICEIFQEYLIFEQERKGLWIR